MNTRDANADVVQPSVQTGRLLEARGLACGYGERSVVHDLDLYVDAAEVVVLLGPNGVGKTTTLLTLIGDLAPLAGEVSWLGAPTRRSLDWRARGGLGFVPEERAVFPGLSAIDNLRVGRGELDLALDLFPEIKPRLNVKAGQLSGGEQQMLILARALSRQPKLLVADELSLGLAPLIVERLFRAIRAAASGGVGVLLVEQHVRKVLPYSDRAYVMSRGRIALSGSASEISDQIDVVEATYLAPGKLEASAATSGTRDDE